MEFWLHSYDYCSVTHEAFVIAAQVLKNMRQIELTSTLVVALITIVVFSAMTVPIAAECP